jgi:metacaspase-1
VIVQNGSNTKKALLVGINKYPSAPLSGCVNDVTDMKAILIANYGFADGDIKLLKDGDATTENILKGLAWLTAGTKSGDTRFFHYSGHGAEYAGGDVTQQPNGQNQIICPVDFDWTEAHMIKDVQFVDVFKTLPDNVIFNWISDSCHSGDLTRVLSRNESKSKFYPVPPPVNVAIQLEKAKKQGRRGFVQGSLDVGYVSGCRFDQTSADTYDSTGRPRGALTWYFLDVLSKSPTSALKDVVSTTMSNLKRDGYSQEPQAEGARVVSPFLNPFVK